MKQECLQHTKAAAAHPWQWRVVPWVGGVLLCMAGGPLAFGAGDALPVHEVASGVFVHQGEQAAATPKNQGAIANVGFIIGSRCVAVIDTGGSLAQGKALRAAIRRRTALPVCYVINTHVHPDHIYGNAAFLQDEPHFIGHHNLAASMRARRDYYTKYLARTLGPELARPSTMIEPDQTVASSRRIELGQRTLVLRAWPTSHSASDLTVLDEASGTLWLGDLLFRGQVPVLDGSLSGWLSSMNVLSTMIVDRVVPGHGAVSTDWPAALAPQQRYLQGLQADVRAALQAHLTLAQTVARLGPSPPGQWVLINDAHRHNITVAYTELEWED